jgi:hypothetical protein
MKSGKGICIESAAKFGFCGNPRHLDSQPPRVYNGSIIESSLRPAEPGFSSCPPKTGEALSYRQTSGDSTMSEYSEEYHQKLARFHSMYGSLDRDAFVDAFPHPFLVFELAKTSRPPKYLQDYADSAEANQATVPEVNVEDESLEIFVAPVQKTERNKMPGNISLGRKPWNDIVIPHPNVSKMHGYFREKEGRYFLADVSSTRGTFLKEKKLPPATDVEISSKDKVNFAGSVSARFFSAADFFDFMAIFSKST